MRPSITVLMPAYNEAEGIADAVQEVKEQLLDRLPEARLLVVNDGSCDKTGEILDELARADVRIRVVHKKNGGHGPALITGLEVIDTDFVLLVDSDQQIPIACFWPLWAAVESGRDAAFGVRRRRHDPRLRLLLTRIIRQALRILFGVRLYDANVPFKVIRREQWLDAHRFIPSNTLAPSLFLALYMKMRGLDIAEIDVEHRERETGEVSIRRWRLLKFCARAFRQLTAFRTATRAHALS